MKNCAIQVGSFLDKSNNYYDRAVLDDQGRWISELSGARLRNFSQRVEYTARLLDNGKYLITDVGKKRSGLWFVHDYPVLEAGMSLLYDGNACMWLRPSEVMSGSYDILSVDDDVEATCLLVRIKWVGKDAEASLTRRIESYSPQYVKIGKSKSGNSGSAWLIIPKEKLNEDLLF